MAIGAGNVPSWGPFTNLILDDRTLRQSTATPVNDHIHLIFLMPGAGSRQGLDMLENPGWTYRAEPCMQRPREISRG